MHDNAPAPAAIASIESLTKQMLRNDKFMEWPDLNAIKGTWNIIKMFISANSKQFSSKNQFQEGITTIWEYITLEEILN